MNDQGIIGYILTDINTESAIEFALGESPYENLIVRDEKMNYTKVINEFKLKKLGIYDIYEEEQTEHLVKDSIFANIDGMLCIDATMDYLYEFKTEIGTRSLDEYEYIISGVPDLINSGTRPACGPVSGMNIVYYWDANGYGNLVTSSDSYDSIYAELYGDMNSFWVSPGQYATDPNWYDDGLDAYFDRHNYTLPFSSDFYPSISDFSSIKNQVDDDNPGTILFNSSSSYGAHYTTLVGYAENSMDEHYYVIHDLWEATSTNIYRNWDDDVYYDDVVWGYYLFDIN